MRRCHTPLMSSAQLGILRQNWLAPARYLQAPTCLHLGCYSFEVAAKRRQIDSTSFILLDWVMECHQKGRIRKAVDLKLNSIYVIEEAELVLELGLLYSHHRPEARPSMRQVTRYLSRDDQLPAIDDWGFVDFRSFSEMNSRMLLAAISFDTIIGLAAISFDTIIGSHISSASGSICTTSIDTG